MSRVGNAAITVPSGVEIAIDGSNITVKGSKGELSRELPGGVTANLDEQTLTVVRPDDSKESRAFHGLSRSLVQNMIVGVTEGFVKELQIQGVGYRATAKGSNALELALAGRLDALGRTWWLHSAAAPIRTEMRVDGGAGPWCWP